MTKIIPVFIAIAIIVTVIAIYSIIRQKSLWESYSREFKDLIYEAELLKQDLNVMMENVIDLTRNLIDDLDNKAVKTTVKEAEMIPNQPQAQSLLYDNKNENKNKLRVYELAQELNMDSNQLLTFLAGLGNYSSDMDFLDEHTVKVVKNFYSLNKEAILKTSYADHRLTEQINKNEKELDIEQLKNAHPYIAVRVLHDKGYSIKEIARILGRGQGEVNLLLNLSKKAKVIQN